MCSIASYAARRAAVKSALAGDDAEHAAAGRDERAIDEHGGRVGDRDARDRGRGIQALDRPAGDRLVGVALAGEHDDDARVVRERRIRHAAEAAGRGREQQLRQRGVEPGEHDLGLGVAEPRVELDDPDALRRDDEPAVEEADERGALGLERADRRQRDRVEHLVDERRLGTPAVGEPGQRRVGAHAAGVRAGVAVADALVVLGGAERHDVVAVGEEEERDLLAVEELLDQDRALLQVVLGVARARHRGRR